MMDKKNYSSLDSDRKFRENNEIIKILKYQVNQEIRISSTEPVIKQSCSSLKEKKETEFHQHLLRCFHPLLILLFPTSCLILFMISFLFPLLSRHHSRITSPDQKRRLWGGEGDTPLFLLSVQETDV